MIEQFCFDIETRATTNQAVLEKIRHEEERRPCPGKPKSDNPKQATIDKYEAAKEVWEKGLEERIMDKIDATAKDPLLAEPICMSAVCDGELVNWSAMHGVSEHDMLLEIMGFISDNCNEDTAFSGFCIKIFDLAVIVTRCRYHGIAIPSFFPFYNRFWRGNVVDIQELIYSRKPFLSFKDAASTHGIKVKGMEWKGSPMHGGRVQDALRAGEYDMILDYCDQDAMDEWDLLNLCMPKSACCGQTMREQVTEVLGSDLSDAMKVLTIKNLIGE
jgi:hypothetical protein